MKDYRDYAEEAFQSYKKAKTREEKFLNYLSWRLYDCEVAILDSAFAHKEGWEQEVDNYVDVHNTVSEIANEFQRLYSSGIENTSIKASPSLTEISHYIESC